LQISISDEIAITISVMKKVIVILGCTASGKSDLGEGVAMRLGGDGAAGQVAAQEAPPFVEVAHLGAIGRRPVEGSVARGFVGDGDFEARAEVGDLGLVELFLLVGNVAALAGFAEAVVNDIVRKVDLNEYKRRQAPIDARITPRGFFLKQVAFLILP